MKHTSLDIPSWNCLAVNYEFGHIAMCSDLADEGSCDKEEDGSQTHDDFHKVERSQRTKWPFA